MIFPRTSHVVISVYNATEKSASKCISFSNIKNLKQSLKILSHLMNIHAPYDAPTSAVPVIYFIDFVLAHAQLSRIQKMNLFANYTSSNTWNKPEPISI